MGRERQAGGGGGGGLLKFDFKGTQGEAMIRAAIAQRIAQAAPHLINTAVARMQPARPSRPPASPVRSGADKMAD